MTEQEYKNYNARREQINEAAENASAKCREEIRQVYKVAYIEGANWADSHRVIDPRDLFFSMPMPIQRNEDGSVAEETKNILRNLPTNMGIIARRKNDNMIHFLDPETNSQNDYEVLDEFPDFEEIKLVYMA
jgi:hypothetical protein